jgi:hypothetical protein
MRTQRVARAGGAAEAANQRNKPADRFHQPSASEGATPDSPGVRTQTAGLQQIRPSGANLPSSTLPLSFAEGTTSMNWRLAEERHLLMAAM